MLTFENFINKIEAEREIRIPRSVLKLDCINELENILKSSNPSKAFLLSKYYNNFDKILDLEEIFSISKKLKEKRELNHYDINLIKKIIKLENYNSKFLFDIIGNLIHTEQLIDDLSNAKNLTLNIEVTIKLWIYMNFLELITKIFSEFIKSNIEKNFKNPKKNKILKKFKDGKHPTMGDLIECLFDLNIIENKNNKECFFTKNKLIRNSIAHNNMYFDSSEECIFFSSGQKYELMEFHNDFNYLQNFILEFIFQLNKEKTDIRETIQKTFKDIGKIFLRVQRNPILRRKFNEIILNWK